MIKGVPVPIETEEIKEELETREFHPENVHRIRSRRDKLIVHMVLVSLLKTEKHIYQIKDLMGLIITVEEQKNTARIGQCHRCQRFGHHCSPQMRKMRRKSRNIRLYQIYKRTASYKFTVAKIKTNHNSYTNLNRESKKARAHICVNYK